MMFFVESFKPDLQYRLCLMDIKTCNILHKEYFLSIEHDYWIEVAMESEDGKIKFLGLPVINAGDGFRLGIVAAGDTAVGLVASGRIAIGLVASGALAVGVLAAGAFAFGLLRAAGAISFGLKSAGAIAFGRDARGALAVGKDAKGAFAYSLGKSE
jgi:hypothetical protein